MQVYFGNEIPHHPQVARAPTACFKAGGRPLIAGQHEDTRGQCPERRGVQARWTYERQGSNRLRTRRGETAPVRGHTSGEMHTIQAQLSEELHQLLVDRTFQCAYACQWTLFHASRSFTLPGGSAGGGSSPSLYNLAALPHSTLARASGVRCPRSCAMNRVAPGQMQALCG